MLLKFNIKAEIVNLNTTETVILTQFHQVDVVPIPGVSLYGNAHLIASGHIYKMLGDSLDEYLTENDITQSDIDINSYEIAHNNDHVTMYFINPENPSVYTMTPSIIAEIEEATKAIPAPEGLVAEALEPTSIKWTWEESEGYAHYVLDEKDNVVATLPIGVNEFIEIALEYETTYTRKLMRYNKDGTSNMTPPVSFTTGVPEIKDFNYNPGLLTPSIMSMYEKSIYSPYNGRIEAFKSGIGDTLDLLVKKQRDGDYHNEFTLESYLTGIRCFDAEVYPPVDAKVTFTAVGKEATKHWDGHATLKLECSTIHDLHVTVNELGYEPMDVLWQVCVDVQYQHVKEKYVDSLESVSDKLF